MNTSDYRRPAGYYLGRPAEKWRCGLSRPRQPRLQG